MCIPLLYYVVGLIVLLTLIMSIADNSSSHLTISRAAILVFDITIVYKDIVNYCLSLCSIRVCHMD